jgi:hypothetical protein
MKFGKLFKKLIAIHPEFANLSANRFSALTYKELRSIAKVLYRPANPGRLTWYMRQNHDTLAKSVYSTLMDW